MIIINAIYRAQKFAVQLSKIKYLSITLIWSS